MSECHIKRLLKQMGLSTKEKISHIPENINQKTIYSQILIGDLNAENLLNENQMLLFFSSNNSEGTGNGSEGTGKTHV